MFVSETSILPPTGMRVRVLDMEGQEFIIDLNPDSKIDDVKIRSLGHFLNPADSMKSSLYHKILLVRTGKVLSDEKTLSQEGVTDNDELIILKKRLVPSRYESKDPLQKDEGKKITMDTIKEVTCRLPVAKAPKAPETPPNLDFQTELRKILVSLIEASQKILCLNPEASKIFKQAEDMLKESTEPKIDQVSLRKLTEMGFPEGRAKKALVLNKMSVTESMEWLIQHESDPNIDEPVPGTEEVQEPEDQTEGAVGGVEDNDEGQSPQVTNILKSLRAFRKREFKANPRALQNLVEMGFPEKDAIDALRVGRNDQDAACDWLLGDRKTKPEEMEEGIDTNSSIYKAIMANPTVQLGLNNPRCLLAFLQMLESPFMTQQWLNDPETGPLLVQISRIYHSEKHSGTQSDSATKTTETMTLSSSISSSGSSDSSFASTSTQILSSQHNRTSQESLSIANSQMSRSESDPIGTRSRLPDNDTVDSRSRLPEDASSVSLGNSPMEGGSENDLRPSVARQQRDAGSSPVTMSRSSSSGKVKGDNKPKGR
ncbi:ubiquitin-associated domain-containing protein 1-like [Mizuhopecten yessoensis]|uniref:Ubiquitin-associated domain-containing protein 1 n=1 Tax=Mizuhopecten yessoensis TaxID=6573 RepID=A0A210QS78_MIZYE|nr:ubiquitin-associated domain-containing protein 1-like [Mizuhopecten yessoensis]OWF51590.1 Ubiquitin-associated domain-containing protein 1 [Mizuhopecten yessoensis]